MAVEFKMCLRTFGVLVFMLHFTQARAQYSDPENLFYEDFKTQLTLRYYFSKKYTGLSLNSSRDNFDLVYMPNSTLNMGIGATYQDLTLNLAYGFGFLNPERGRGETKKFDLQAHIYPKKFVIDFFGQFYDGYFLDHSRPMIGTQDSPLLLPEMRVRKIGAAVQYLFNYDEFSYRAAFLQNEWQKKSAGTLLMGFEMYGGQGHNDSGLIPPVMLDDERPQLSQISYFEFGPSLGYAYTWVIQKHFFITASASSHLALGYTDMEYANQGQSLVWNIQPNFFLRGFAGYNSKKWSVNVNYVYNRINLNRINGNQSSMMTGNYRLNFIHRIDPGKGLRKYLRHVDRLKNKLGLE